MSRIRPAAGALWALLVLMPAVAAQTSAPAGETSAPAPPGETRLFRFEGQEYTVHDLSPRLRRMFFELQQEHHREAQALADGMLFEVWLQREAAARKLPPRALARELLAVPEPDDAALAAYQALHMQQFPGELQAQRDALRESLMADRLRERRDQLLAGLRSEGEFELLYSPPPPPPPVNLDTRGFPRQGPQDAPVTVVAFMSFRCPLCVRASAVLSAVQADFGDTLAWVYVPLPIDPPGAVEQPARAVAEGAVCADRQRRFWDYQAAAYARDANLVVDSPRALAELLDLDLVDFFRCMEGRPPKVMLARAERQARELGLLRAPAIYVNGRPLRGSGVEDELRAEIRRLLARP